MYKNEHVGQKMPGATEETLPAAPGSARPCPEHVVRQYYHEAGRDSSRVAASSVRVGRRDRILQQWSSLKRKGIPRGSPGPQPRGSPRIPSEIFKIQHLKTYSILYIKQGISMEKSSASW